MYRFCLYFLIVLVFCCCWKSFLALTKIERIAQAYSFDLAVDQYLPTNEWDTIIDHAYCSFALCINSNQQILYSSLRYAAG